MKIGEESVLSLIEFHAMDFLSLFHFAGECIPPRTISLAAATFNLLVTIADLDIATFQVSGHCEL